MIVDNILWSLECPFVLEVCLHHIVKRYQFIQRHWEQQSILEE